MPQSTSQLPLPGHSCPDEPLKSFDSAVGVPEAEAQALCFGFSQLFSPVGGCRQAAPCLSSLRQSGLKPLVVLMEGRQHPMPAPFFKEAGEALLKGSWVKKVKKGLLNHQKYEIHYIIPPSPFSPKHKSRYGASRKTPCKMLKFRAGQFSAVQLPLAARMRTCLHSRLTSHLDWLGPNLALLSLTQQPLSMFSFLIHVDMQDI